MEDGGERGKLWGVMGCELGVKGKKGKGGGVVDDIGKVGDEEGELGEGV